MMDKNRVLAAIFELAADDGEWGVSFYPERHNLPEAELYFKAPDGTCWQVTVKDHTKQHGGGQTI